MADNPTIKLTVDLDPMALAGAIVESTATEDQVFELIKEIDRHMVDWEFTERLRDYFVKEIEKLEAIDKARQERKANA